MEATVTRLDEIQQRLEAATPGPWEHLGGYPQQVFGVLPHANGADEPGRVLIAELFTGPQVPPADADLIAHAPADLAALLAVARAAQDVLPKLGISTHEPMGTSNICFKCGDAWPCSTRALRAALADVR